MLPRPRCAALALLAVAAVFVWQALTVHANFNGNWTALFCTGDKVPPPPPVRESTYIFRNSDGYDGQYYRYIAMDPFGMRYAAHVDDPRLRFPRVLVPALAYAAGFGRWTDAGFIATVAAFCGLGVYWTSRYLARYSIPPAAGLLFLAMPAVLTSFDRMLLDGALLALFAAFLLYAEEDRWTPLLVVCAAAPLTRDTGIFLPAAAVAHFVVARDWKRASAFAASALPAAAWWAWVVSRTEPTGAAKIFSWPIIGIFQRLFTPRAVEDPLTQAILRTVDPIALTALLAALALGARETIRLRPIAIKTALGLFLLLGAFLTDAWYLDDAYGFSRAVSPILLVLATSALIRREWWNLLPPAALSLAVGVYFVSPLKGIALAAIRLITDN